jgi:hypothetical protein
LTFRFEVYCPRRAIAVQRTVRRPTKPTQLEHHVEKAYRRETPAHILNDIARAQRGEDLGEGSRAEPD